ncbi:MAG: S41 family peptidase [Phycisphaerales bacterium]|nr:S41 family peptidase [Phycisphaerales bacterium]
MKKDRRVFEASLVVILGVAVLGSTLAVTRGVNDYEWFNPIIDVKKIISDKYVEAPDEALLQQGAINGMIEALKDPYTVYVPPKEKRNFDKELTGEYVGIGAQVIQEDGWLKVVSPLEDSPALQAGLMADDKIIEIEGKTTLKVPVDDCIAMLQGEPGTPVNILIDRAGEQIKLTIIRNHIKTKSVKGFHREEADSARWMYLIDPARRIAYIRLSQFTPGCAEEIRAALDSVGADKGELNGLVLDLRFNPGGLLSEAIMIADLFLNDGVIVSTRGRASVHAEEIAKAHEPGTYPDFPIAVLVNGSSASASEVLSGALVENNRCVVVGTRSFGKGSVQTLQNLENGGELKVTEQGYYLPSGRSIQRKDDKAEWGVDPTKGFYVPMSTDELQEMIRVRLIHEVLRTGKPVPAAVDPAKVAEEAEALKSETPEDWSNPDWILETLKDKQLAAAVRAVQGRVETGEWKPTGEEGIAGKTIALDELKRIRDFRERLTRELMRLDKQEEALEIAADDKAAAEPQDLWSDDLDLTGGKLRIFDKSGKLVAILDITGRDVERWLQDADVKIDPESPGKTESGHQE